MQSSNKGCKFYVLIFLSMCLFLSHRPPEYSLAQGLILMRMLQSHFKTIGAVSLSLGLSLSNFSSVVTRRTHLRCRSELLPLYLDITSIALLSPRLLSPHLLSPPFPICVWSLSWCPPAQKTLLVFPTTRRACFPFNPVLCSCSSLAFGKSPKVP